MKRSELHDPVEVRTEINSEDGKNRYVCGKCGAPVAFRDRYCRYCGEGLIWKNEMTDGRQIGSEPDGERRTDDA